MDREVVFIYLRACMHIYVTIVKEIEILHFRESKGVGGKKKNMEKVCNCILNLKSKYILKINKNLKVLRKYSCITFQVPSPYSKQSRNIPMLTN